MRCCSARWVGPEGSHGAGVEVDGAPRPGGLGLGGDQFALHLHEGLADHETADVEVKGVPGQTQHLATAEAREGGKPEERAVVVVGGGGEEAAELVGCPHGLLGRPGRCRAGRCGAPHRVAGDEALALGVGERPAEHGVQEADGAGREPGGVHGPVDGVDVQRAELTEPHRADHRQCVALDEAAVAGDRGRTPAGGRQLVEPRPEVRAGRETTRGDEHALAHFAENLDHRGVRRLLRGEAAALDLPTVTADAGHIDGEAPRAALGVLAYAASGCHARTLRLVAPAARRTVATSRMRAP